MTNRLGTLIKRLRTARGLSQRALAARAGITNPYIAQLETGQRGNPTVLVAARLATALGVPVMKLIECVMKDEAQTASSERRSKR
jgi:transcriptional regulator with XRE-family HTH domain